MTDLHNRPILSDGTVTVRPPRPGDVDARMALGVSAEIVRMYGHIIAEDRPTLPRDEAQAWYDRQYDDPLGFCIDHEGALVGFLRLHSLHDQNQFATLGVGLLDPGKLGHGIGTAAMRLILAYGFDTIGLHRVSLRVLHNNHRAIAAYRKLGFVEEGRLRESCRVGDAWQDDVAMGLLAREFVR